MVSRRHQPLFRRVPGWLIILTTLMTASVIAERVQAATRSSDAGGTEYHPRIGRLMTDRAVAFVLTFDQIVSHSGSQLTLVTPTGGTRRKFPTAWLRSQTRSIRRLAVSIPAITACNGRRRQRTGHGCLAVCRSTSARTR